jgi:hypothetical protein
MDHIHAMLNRQQEKKQIKFYKHESLVKVTLLWDRYRRFGETGCVLIH